MRRMEYKTGQLLIQLGNMVTWFRNQKLQSKNLTSEQAGIIGFLEKKEDQGITICELAKEMSRSKAAVSEILKKMEQKSLIRRCEDLSDGRKKYVFLTEQGRNMEKDLMKASRESERIVLQGMSEAEQEEFCRLLEIAYKNMNVVRRIKHNENLFQEQKTE